MQGPVLAFSRSLSGRRQAPSADASAAASAFRRFAALRAVSGCDPLPFGLGGLAPAPACLVFFGGDAASSAAFASAAAFSGPPLCAFGGEPRSLLFG